MGLNGYTINNRERFDITVHNPCTDNNKIVKTEQDGKPYQQFIKYELDPTMIKWTTREYNLRELFADSYSLQEGIGTCGDILVTIEDQD